MNAVIEIAAYSAVIIALSVIALSVYVYFRAEFRQWKLSRMCKKIEKEKRESKYSTSSQSKLK